jgi:hypothetical protein
VLASSITAIAASLRKNQDMLREHGHFLEKIIHFWEKQSTHSQRMETSLGCKNWHPTLLVLTRQRVVSGLCWLCLVSWGFPMFSDNCRSLILPPFSGTLLPWLAPDLHTTANPVSLLSLASSSEMVRYDQKPLDPYTDVRVYNLSRRRNSYACGRTCETHWGKHPFAPLL